MYTPRFLPVLLSFAVFLVNASGEEFRRTCAPGSASESTLRVSVKTEGGKVRLIVGSGGDARTVPVEHYLRYVSEVCRLKNGKSLVVGSTTSTAMPLIVLDHLTGTVLDEFYAYAPALLPDGRWLAFRRFYPLQGDVASEQYMIYDTTRGPQDNRVRDVYGDEVIGVQVYPVEAKPSPNTGVPIDQLHAARSAGFFWNSDSTAFVFADYAHQRLSIVLVDVAKTPRAFTYSVPAERVCADPKQLEASVLFLKDATVRGQRQVHAEFKSYGSTCRPNSLLLTGADLTPAAQEPQWSFPERLPTFVIPKPPK